MHHEMAELEGFRLLPCEEGQATVVPASFFEVPACVDVDAIKLTMRGAALEPRQAMSAAGPTWAYVSQTFRTVREVEHLRTLAAHAFARFKSYLPHDHDHPARRAHMREYFRLRKAANTLEGAL